MATIDTSYFFGNLLIAQKSDSSVSSSLVWFIDQHEPRLLTDLLGYELYKNYLAGIAGNVQKYLYIRDGTEFTNRAGILTKWRGVKYLDGTAKKSLIANYIFCRWMENETSFTTGTGEKVANNQNAINVSNGHKIIMAWNEMADMIAELCEFLLSKQTDYPEFVLQFSRMDRSFLNYKNLSGI